MNLEFIKNLPLYQKTLALGLVVILIVAMFFWIFYLPKNNQIKAIGNDIAKLESEIDINRAKADKLERLKKENAFLERQLAEKKKQLPPEAEVASLLKQISDLGIRIGLDFKLWRPSARKQDPEGLYSEIPVDVEIAGSYHTTALFFDSISKLRRIVNIRNINMMNPRLENGRLVIKTTFVATAFATVDEETAGTAAQGGSDGSPPATGSR